MKYIDVLHKLAKLNKCADELDPFNDLSFNGTFSTNPFISNNDQDANAVNQPQQAAQETVPTQKDWMGDVDPEQWYNDLSNSPTFKQQQTMANNYELKDNKWWNKGLGFIGTAVGSFNIPGYSGFNQFRNGRIYAPDNLSMSWKAQTTTPYESYVLYGRNKFDDTTQAGKDRRALYNMAFSKSMQPEKEGQTYYSPEEMEIIARTAKQYNLSGADLFDKYTPEQLSKIVNGVSGPDYAPVRYAAHRVNPMFAVSAAIHDLRFHNAKGTTEDWEDANKQMYDNLYAINNADNYPGSPMHWQTENRNIPMYIHGLGSKSRPIYDAYANRNNELNHTKMLAGN